MHNATTHNDEKTRDPAHSEEEQSDESGTKDEPDVPAPFAPDSDEDSALGDTDEHSDA